MADATLSIVINARNNASAALQGIQKDVGGLQGSLGKLATIAGGVGLERLGEGAGQFLGSAAQAAADDAASLAKLKQAVENSGASYDTYKSQLEGVIDAGMKKGFTDDQTRDALSLLTAQTGSASEAMKRYGLAQDLARGANIDVVTASKLLGKVTDDNVNVLNRYGISVQKGASEAELFGAIQQKFGGQADAFANSTAGQMASAKIQMSELKEQIGYAVLPALALLADVLATKIAPAIATTIGFLTEHKGEVLAFAAGVAAVLVPAFIAWAISAASAAIATLVALAPLILVTAAVGLLALGLYELVTHWDTVKEKTMEVVGWMSDFIDEHFSAIKQIVVDAFEVVKGEVETAMTVIRDIIKIVTAVFTGDWSAAWDGIKQLVGDVLEGIVSDITLKLGLVRDIMGLAWVVVKGAAGIAWDELKSLISTAIDDVVGFVEAAPGRIAGFIGNMTVAALGLGMAFKDGVVNGIRGGFGALGDITAELWDALRSILNSAIDAINDFIPDEIVMPGAIPNINLPDNPIPHLAAGVMAAKGGAYIVGEYGPELAMIPAGARVLPAWQTRQAMQPQSQPTVIHNNTYVYPQQIVINGDPRTGLAALGLGV